MKLERTLTKENFFNRMMESYPVACKRFCDWIDEYKKEADWSILFLHRRRYIKYHDIPHAMQLGIFIAFIRDTTPGQDYVIDLMAFNFEDLIEEHFKHTNE